MPEPRTAESPRLTNDAERDRVVAKIERGLADIQAGRLISHAEVLARIEARYPVQPGSKL